MEVNESQIQAAIRLQLGRLPDLTLWRNQVGRTQHGTQHVTYGLCRGSSDLIGILAPTGRIIALEIKTPKGRTSPEQDLFLELIRNKGGFAAVVRSPEEALEAIERARRGLNS